MVTASLTATGQSGTETLREFYYGISGTFTATVKVQIQDRTGTWHDYASKTAAAFEGRVELAVPMPIRFNCTAFTSGTIVCELGGK
jgi:hypothetical protein